MSVTKDVVTLALAAIALLALLVLLVLLLAMFGILSNRFCAMLGFLTYLAQDFLRPVFSGNFT
jgi:hypothetical protein